MRHTHILALLASSVILAACGGGGGSETPAPAPTQRVQTAAPPAPATIWTFEKERVLLLRHTASKSASFIYDFYATDINNDGKDDIITGGPQWRGDQFLHEASNIEVLVSNGNGYTNSPELLFADNTGPQLIHMMNIIVEDFDRDGNDDIVFSGTGLDIFEDGLGDTMQYYISDGNGKLHNRSTQLNFDQAGFFHSASAGDFDGDGAQDLTMWQCCLLPNIELETPGNMLINNGIGEFEYDPSLLPETVTVNHNWAINEVLSVDLNNTTCDDIVAVGYTDDHNDFIMWNYCDGALSDPGIGYNGIAPTSYSIPKVEGYPQSTTVASIDYNNDNYQDLVIARVDDYGVNNTHVQILRNNGDQTFTDVTAETIGEFNMRKWIAHIHVEDLDQDGYQDMVFTADNTFYDADVNHMVWRGTATGFESVDLELGKNTGSLIVADVTGDGASDLVIRYVVEHTFGTDNQQIEYYMLKNAL